MVDDAVDKDKPHNSSAKDAHLIFVGNREYTVWNNFVKRSDALLYVLPAALLTFRLPFGSVASHVFTPSAFLSAASPFAVRVAKVRTEP